MSMKMQAAYDLAQASSMAALTCAGWCTLRSHTSVAKLAGREDHFQEGRPIDAKDFYDAAIESPDVALWDHV